MSERDVPMPGPGSDGADAHPPPQPGPQPGHGGGGAEGGGSGGPFDAGVRTQLELLNHNLTVLYGDMTAIGQELVALRTSVNAQGELLADLDKQVKAVDQTLRQELRSLEVVVRTGFDDLIKRITAHSEAQKAHADDLAATFLRAMKYAADVAAKRVPPYDDKGKGKEN
ncbi:unnamed protein product [Peniophora sp. CBMAI 1063]|nr:unnamed protein product [Peniophora sp. CBMAI 1063]